MTTKQHPNLTPFDSERAKAAGGVSYYKKRYEELLAAYEDLKQSIIVDKNRLLEREKKVLEREHAVREREILTPEMVVSQMSHSPLQMKADRYDQLAEKFETGELTQTEENLMWRLGDELITHQPKPKAVESISEAAKEEDGSDDIDAILAKYK